MENLNAEQVKEALECCHTPVASDCNKCGYRGRSVENGEYIGCTNRLIKDALALINSQEQRIKELAEENERLRELNKQLETDNFNANMNLETVAEENERLKNRVTLRVVIPDDKLEEIKTECLERVELDIKEIKTEIALKMVGRSAEWASQAICKLDDAINKYSRTGDDELTARLFEAEKHGITRAFVSIDKIAKELLKDGQ